MINLHQRFVDAYVTHFFNKTVYSASFPEAMKAAEKDSEGWIEWKPIKGTLQESDYHELETSYGVVFPKSFIDWHRAYYFLDGNCSILSLPASNPMEPLEDLRRTLNWYIPRQLIPQKIYPFGDAGNDEGLLVFDGRSPMPDNEFSIRVYDHEFGGASEGLSAVIFSSFKKLLECTTHYLVEQKTRKSFEIIPEFFAIDPTGAGKTGVDYWTSWADMQKATFEEFGE